MQPTGQDRAFRELPGILRQSQKDGLRYVLGQMRIANHPQRGGINQVNVPARQFGEVGFGLAIRIVSQELLVGQVVHFTG